MIVFLGTFACSINRNSQKTSNIMAHFETMEPLGKEAEPFFLVFAIFKNDSASFRKRSIVSKWAMISSGYFYLPGMKLSQKRQILWLEIPLKHQCSELLDFWFSEFDNRTRDYLIIWLIIRDHQLFCCFLAHWQRGQRLFSLLFYPGFYQRFFFDKNLMFPRPVVPYILTGP